ncbi:MAG: hypothetical protein AAF471_07500 [Myxococcota bacterium]
MGVTKAGVGVGKAVQGLAQGTVKEQGVAINIHDHELQRLGIGREKFAKLRPALQEKIKNALENRDKKEAVAATVVEIQDRELRYLRISREDFEKLGLDFQRIFKRIAESGLRREEEERKERLRKEALDEKRQLQLGFCDTLTPSRTPGNIKTALTVDRNRLFVVGSFPKRYRKYERQIKNSDGEVLTQTVSIGRGKGSLDTFGVLTQSHQAVMYEVFHLWAQSGKRITESDGRPRAFIAVTPHQLVTSVCNSTSRESYNRVRTLVRELATIPITIENAYTRNGIVAELEFRIFGEVEWRVRGKRKKGESGPTTGTKGTGRVYIQVSAFATECFLHGHVKEFSLKTYKELGGIRRRGRHDAISRALYSLLDTELITKEMYNVSLVNLFAELGLCPYDSKSKRKEKIERAVEMLHGEVICGGVYRLQVYLRPSSDRSDYILQAKRVQATATERRHNAISRALYSLLDTELMTQEMVTISLVNLFAKLGIRPYKYKSKRKQKVESALAVLHGEVIRGGAYRLQIYLRPSNDRSDYILQAERVKLPRALSASGVPRDAVTTALYSLLDTELTAQDVFTIGFVSLLSRLGLRSYKYKNKRKEKIEDALAALEGQAVCKGAYRLQMRLRLSDDCGDYILMAKRVPAPPPQGESSQEQGKAAVVAS